MTTLYCKTSMFCRFRGFFKNGKNLMPQTLKNTLFLFNYIKKNRLKQKFDARNILSSKTRKIDVLEKVMFYSIINFGFDCLLNRMSHQVGAFHWLFFSIIVQWLFMKISLLIKWKLFIHWSFKPFEVDLNYTRELFYDT